MAGSASHGCFINCHGLRRKTRTKDTYNITSAKKYPLHCWWTELQPHIPRLGWIDHGRSITPGQAGLVTVQFVLRQFLFFFLAEVPHYMTEHWFIGKTNPVCPAPALFSHPKQVVQKIDFEIRLDLGCTAPKTSRKVVLDNPSVCLSVCLAVCLSCCRFSRELSQA